MKYLFAVLVFCAASIYTVAQATTCATAKVAQDYPCSVTLTWVDNSGNDPKVNDQEAEFYIDYQVNGGAWQFLGKTGPNVTTYQDTTLVQAVLQDNTYCYRVQSANYTKANPPVRQASAWTPAACYTVAKAATPIIPPATPGSVTITFLDGNGKVATMTITATSISVKPARAATKSVAPVKKK